jgi:hypothetical protein
MTALRIGKRWSVGVLIVAGGLMFRSATLSSAVPAPSQDQGSITACDPIDPRLRPGPQAGQAPPSRLIVISGTVTSTVLRGETAVFDNLVGLASPVDTTLYLSKAVIEGEQFTLGSFAAGTELVFRITTPQGATYYTGPGHRNPDGLVHANVVQLAANTYWVGWEDLFAGGDSDYDDVFFQVCGHLAVATIDVAIDIKPQSEPNSVNADSRGKIPVAILSTEHFDAPSEVDTRSLTFGRTGDENSLHLRGRPRVPNCGEEDVNGDGQPDLVCHFYTQRSAFESGDIAGILKGTTITGDTFVGVDGIRTVPR